MTRRCQASGCGQAFRGEYCPACGLVPTPLPVGVKPKGKVRHHRGGRKVGTKNVRIETMLQHRAAWEACQSTAEREALAARLGLTLSTLYNVATKLDWPRGRRGYSLAGVPNAVARWQGKAQ